MQGDASRVHRGAGKTPVAVHALRQNAHPRHLRRPGQHVHLRCVDRRPYAAALDHLQQMPHQGETGNIGAGMDRELHHHIPGGLVQRGHLPVDRLHLLQGEQSSLIGGGENAHPQGLGQQQHIAGPCAAVGQNPVRVDEAGDGQTVFGLLVKNAVAAGN